MLLLLLLMLFPWSGIFEFCVMETKEDRLFAFSRPTDVLSALPPLIVLVFLDLRDEPGEGGITDGR